MLPPSSLCYAVPSLKRLHFYEARLTAYEAQLTLHEAALRAMKRILFRLHVFLPIRAKKMATPPGFEPELSGPKPLVLPLHNGVA